MFAAALPPIGAERRFVRGSVSALDVAQRRRNTWEWDGWIGMMKNMYTIFINERRMGCRRKREKSQRG